MVLPTAVLKVASVFLATGADSLSFIRVNQVGYLPDAPKAAPGRQA